jgi:exosortase F-associated protein
MELPMKKLSSRIFICFLGLSGIVLVFVFQQSDILLLVTGKLYSANQHFTINRIARIFFNDAFMLVFLYGLFANKQVLRLAVIIQIIDLFVLLPLYLIIKLQMEGESEISSPFLSQFHRIIVNPTLMILLIPAIFYQKLILQKSQSDRKSFR